jgi:hypothetical protein
VPGLVDRPGVQLPREFADILSPGVLNLIHFGALSIRGPHRRRVLPAPVEWALSPKSESDRHRAVHGGRQATPPPHKRGPASLPRQAGGEPLSDQRYAISSGMYVIVRSEARAAQMRSLWRTILPQGEARSGGGGSARRAPRRRGFQPTPRPWVGGAQRTLRTAPKGGNACPLRSGF